MSLKHYCSIFKPSCIKRDFTMSEYLRVKRTCRRINSTESYDHYRYVYGGKVPYVTFYNTLKCLLYYDKYICTHGTEFYYYVDADAFKCNSRLPTDVTKIINAIGGL